MIEMRQKNACANTAESHLSSLWDVAEKTRMTIKLICTSIDVLICW